MIFFCALGIFRTLGFHPTPARFPPLARVPRGKF